MTCDDIEHGTYGGYQRCVQRWEGSCDECRRAAAERQRERRRSNPAIRARERHYKYARERALWRLKALHPEEFERLFDEELRRGEEGAA